MAEDVRPPLLFLAYFLLGVSLVLVALRCYTRVRVTGMLRWGWDDGFIVFAWVFLAAYAVVLNLILNLNNGQPVFHLQRTHEQSRRLSICLHFMDVDGVLCELITKYSIGIYVLRIKDTRTIRWVLAAIMVSVSLASIALIIAFLLPGDALAKQSQPQDRAASLVQAYMIFDTAYAASAFTIVGDLVLTAMPIFILRNVQITTKQKLRVCVLMSLGLTATVAAAVRNAYQKHIVNPVVNSTLTPIVILSTLDMSAGIIAACIPACMPLFSVWNQRLKDGTSRQRVDLGHGTDRAQSADSSRIEVRLLTAQQNKTNRIVSG